MRVYFLAETPSALYVNGVYLGVVDGFERTVELDPADGVFCELKPGGKLPLSFFFGEEFLFAPPPQIRLYFVKNGVAVYAENFLFADPALRPLWQKRFGGALLTLFVQGKLQLNVENETGFHLIDLPDRFSECEPVPFRGGFLLTADGAFAHVSREGKLLVLSEGTVLEHKTLLKAEVPFHDSVGHTARCVWEDGKLVECVIRTARPPAEDTFALALFESALIGADVTPYLDESLLEKAGSLKEFLGDFRSVVLTDERDLIGLVYPRKERVFDVRYFRVTLAGGKIANIKEE